MKFNKDDAVTGFFVLIGLLLGLATVFTLLGYNFFEDRVHYIVRMDSLAGIKKGTPIQWNNYTVGQVISVTPIYGTNIYFKADVQIERSLILHRGTKLNITKQNIIGDTVMQFIPSLEKQVLMKPGDTLFATNVTNLDQMVNNITGLIGNISKLVGEFGGLTGENRDAIRFMLASAGQSVQKLNSILEVSQVDINKILKNITSTTKTLDAFAKEVAKNPMIILGGGNKQDGTKTGDDKKGFFP